MSIPIEKFGKDHWSTFGYVGCRVTSNKGIPDRQHMRCDADLHPGLAHNGRGGELPIQRKYPTILRGGVEQADHDDWSCVDDLEAAGLVKIGGTGIHPTWDMTDIGWAFCKVLTDFKRKGGAFAGFSEQQSIWPDGWQKICQK